MTVRVIKANADLEEWLSQNDWLHEARVLEIVPYPIEPGQVTMPQVSIRLAYQVIGNYEAFSRRVSRVFHLTCQGITEYTLACGRDHHPDHLSEAIEILECDECIAFTIDIPSLLTIRCEQIKVEQHPDMIEFVKPWLDDSELFSTVPDHKVPTPQEWVDLFREQDQRVAWHMYGGEPEETSKVPEKNYEGWYIQYPQNMDLAHQGVFFFVCTQRDRDLDLRLQNQGASKSLWHAVGVILGNFAGVEISCGNCKFTGPQWLEEIRNETQ